eukprot:TRINITY_DN1124_c0_g1_i5.p1 TRINITY_DN1124_c0_g1~~TRINITY_DN1124_c0_g1_i5.p1  ORF type:complete len:221 (+),score=43.41 TRINITY_DN1124_c0_g1_i5:98-664(+)
MKATLLLLSLISISIATPVIISGYSTVLELYDLDTAGSLKLQHNFTVPSPLTYWAQHPTKFDVFYAVLEGVPDGLVKSFTISGGNITETSSVAVGAGPVHVTVEPQGERRSSIVESFQEDGFTPLDTPPVTSPQSLSSPMAILEPFSTPFRTEQRRIRPSSIQPANISSHLVSMETSLVNGILERMES